MNREARVFYYQLGPLKQFLPCRCAENMDQTPRYHVGVYTSPVTTAGKGSLIQSVYIQCDVCKRIFFENMEDSEIYDCELKF